jgi:hypothetical protein
MSHFTVLVIGEDVEEQLAPYDENISVEPYREYADTKELEFLHRVWDEENDRPPKDDRELARFLNARWDTKEYKYEPQGGIYKMSTYNPRSKWDWYEVGGRWSGYFKLKSEVMDDPDAETAIGKPGVFDNQPRYDADECRKGMVDAEGMRDLAGREAGEAWDYAHSVFGDTPPARAWHDVLADTMDENGEPDVKLAREIYGAQERVIVVREHDERIREKMHGKGKGSSAAIATEEREIVGIFGEGVENYQIPREQYVQEARDRAIAPYAYVADGEWHAPGEMGWFGMSSDTKSDRNRFYREFNEMFDALPDDTLLTLVDCHI